jgi:hypothetical protein
MTPIFDRRGVVVAWLMDERILDRRGRHRAFLRGASVYGYDRRHRGTFKRSFFRDRHGDAVAFVKGATGGPLLPLRQLVPLAPLPQLPPLKPLVSLAPVSPLPTLRWSALTWDQFIDPES